MTQASVIGADTVVRGNVQGQGSLEILGHIEGDVSISGDVLIGAAASVRGNVEGARVSVLGVVQGDLRGSVAVLVESGAKVVGDLSAPRIGIADGGLVRGNVRTEGEPAPVRRPGVATIPARVPQQVPAIARVEPKPVARVEPKPVARVEPKPVAKVEPKPVAKVEPKPVAKVEPKPVAKVEPEVRPAAALGFADDVEPDAETPPPRIREMVGKPPERRPPPPVLPSLGKGAKAKKKRGRDE